ELQTITVEKLANRSATDRALKTDIAALWNLELDQLSASFSVAPPASPEAQARAEARRALLELSGSDPRALLTGLINCLPKASRGAVFRLQPEAQLEALRASAELTDAAIASSFRADSFG